MQQANGVLATASAIETAAAVRNRTVSALETTEAAIARIEALNGPITRCSCAISIVCATRPNGSTFAKNDRPISTYNPPGTYGKTRLVPQTCRPNIPRPRREPVEHGGTKCV